MRFKKIKKIFNDGNVAVVGLRGRGKDMLFANVVHRRKLPYVSNVDYGLDYYYPFDYSKIDVNNTYRNFLNGDTNSYVFPYPDETDIYLSDCGVYFPSQFCNELNRQYASIPTFMALSRHLGKCNVHFNVQNLNRCWDKIREQCDQYILCRRCVYIPFFKIVFQWVTVYDCADSCIARRKPLRLPIPLFATRGTKQNAKIALANYEASYGSIKNGFLVYRNKSSYDTRIFKTMLGGASNEDKK